MKCRCGSGEAGRFDGKTVHNSDECRPFRGHEPHSEQHFFIPRTDDADVEYRIGLLEEPEIDENAEAVWDLPRWRR